jgi:hypothetical protein
MEIKMLEPGLRLMDVKILMPWRLDYDGRQFSGRETMDLKEA